MTTQVLMSTGTILSKTAQSETVDSKIVEPATVDCPQVEGNQSSIASAPPQKLPYQANHQVELLHLQAETEALLQHLKTLKQPMSIEMAERAVETSLSR